MANSDLVIVESPAKAKTIEKYLGAGYIVRSSYGHVRDLKNGDMSVDVEKDFEPTYVVPDDKKDRLRQLQKDADKASIVWLATDEDREGEAISWHLKEALKLPDAKVKRITFHEITKSAIQAAIEKPRSIDLHLVDAQQARRILDRLVGYELSPILWKKVKPSLSAGRVQSVAVRLIVEREREVLAFEAKSSFRIVALLMTNGKAIVKAELPRKFAEEAEARSYLEACSNAVFKVGSVEKKPLKRSPAPPFTTSTLQQEASRKLGFSVAKTMTVAQRLYESGAITYMRTDSVNLSEMAVNAAKGVISQQYGPEYSKPRSYRTKSKGAQEAHEAIRPSDMAVRETGDERDAVRLYDLIWKRTLACQMSDAELEKTTVLIDVSTRPDEPLRAQGEVITFEGFLKVYLEGKDDEDEEQDGLLPAMINGDPLLLQELTATERFDRPPARFSEASLVKKLEELGIGRPSTYAPTISTIQRRDYVVKESREGTPRSYRVLKLVGGSVQHELATEKAGAEKSKLFPTDIGMVVNDFLVEHFETVVDLNFTASVEEEFDEIAEGKMDWRKMLRKFYEPFHKRIQHTEEHAERASGERILGVDPKTGKNVKARIGKFGPMVQIGEVEDEEKPRFASLQKDQSIQTITFDEAMDLFKLPRELGQFEGEVVQVNIGRFGPYVRHMGKFVSLEEGDDPLSMELDRGIELIQNKREVERKRLVKQFDVDPVIQVLNGRYGPYVTDGKKNVTIPKGKDPKELTLEECQKLIEEAPEKKRRGGRAAKGGKAAVKKGAKKKSAAKKSTKKKTATKRKKSP